jgi:hypothetical protein
MNYITWTSLFKTPLNVLNELNDPPHLEVQVGGHKLSVVGRVVAGEPRRTRVVSPVLKDTHAL